jgi:RNA methyltransferase, TrmH family
VITSADNPRVKDVLRLRKARERRRDGLFIAEGVREVERALEAGLEPRAIYVAPELLPEWNRPGVEEVSARVLARMAYRAEPEGLLGVFEAPQRAAPTDATLLLVAVNIEKPGNLGAMARTADAAGVDALLVAGPNFDPWNPNAIRASTGVVFTLPIVEATYAEVAALPQLKIAAVLDASQPHTAPDYTKPTAFMIGAEDTGLDGAWRELADAEVVIPMKGATADSLNASTAAAVLLFEAVRQRATAP